MRKSSELADPRSCLNKAGDDEWLFVLIGRDPAFAATVAFWADERVRLGLNTPDDRKILEARACAAAAEAERTAGASRT